MEGNIGIVGIGIETRQDMDSIFRHEGGDSPLVLAAEYWRAAN